MNMQVRRATVEDASVVSGLVQAGFAEHVAPDWEPSAAEHFVAETSATKLAAAIADATFAGLCESEGETLGVILLPRPTLVQLFFVTPGHLRQGIGKALWESARSYLNERHPDVKTVELNSSPYAVSAYRALGFFPISEAYRRGGAVATRMACWLPGRSLERAWHGASPFHRSAGAKPAPPASGSALPSNGGSTSNIDALRACRFLYLHAISEPAENALCIVVHEARVGGPVSLATSEAEPHPEARKALAESNAIEHGPGCRVFELRWPSYVGYSVENESCASPEPAGSVGEGRLLVEYERSVYLSYLSKATFASTDHPGAFKHWALCCLNHIVNVASVHAPVVDVTIARQPARRIGVTP